MAKHWKSFVKKEKTPKEENAAIENIASLLSPEAKKSDKSLEDVAGFNSNLKSLIEEQKQLEDQMAELTGKKKASNTDKRYEHDIKTIDQKKKEEAEAAEKLKKRKESHRKKQDDRWEVTPSFTPKKREVSSVSPISKKRKTTKPTSTGFIQPKKASKAAIPSIQQKSVPTTVSKQKKKATTLLEFGQKVKNVKKTIDDFTKQPKKSVATVALKSAQKPKTTAQKATKQKTQKPKRQQKTPLKQVGKRIQKTPIKTIKKPVETFSNSVKKGAKKLDSFIDNTAKKKEVQTVKTVVKKASEALDTFGETTKKVSKVNNTFQTVRNTGNDLQSGLEKVTSVTKSPELQKISKKVSKGMGILNNVGKKLTKVDKVFNTANKKLEKTNTVTHLFEKKLKEVDFISGMDAATKHGFDFDFIQQQQTKKEETTSFNVGNKKLQVAIDVIKTAKNVKKGIGILKEVKKQKDSFSF